MALEQVEQSRTVVGFSFDNIHNFKNKHKKESAQIIDKNLWWFRYLSSKDLKTDRK